MTVAQELTGERKSQNLTVNQVARATRISPSLITAIESEDYGRFSAAFYARGCVRLLARHYGLDHRRLKRQFMKELPSNPPWKPNSSRTDTSPDEMDSWCVWVACMRLDGLAPWLVLVGLLACLLGAYSLGHAHGVKAAVYFESDTPLQLESSQRELAQNNFRQ
ncbi:MAG: helix-turn-helix domain-containing protein [Limisphaerales bacterium]